MKSRFPQDSGFGSTFGMGGVSRVVVGSRRCFW